MSQATDGETDTNAGNSNATGTPSLTGDPAASATAPASTEGAGEPSGQPAGAPEKYEFVAPDGVEFDQSLIDRFEPILREANISQEAANKFAGEFAKLREEELKADISRFAEQRQQWVASIKADKEIGGDAFEANLGKIAKVMDKFATPELRELLNSTRVGDHPALFKFVLQFAPLLAEDAPGTGSPAPEAKDIAQRLYPNMGKASG